MTRVSQSGNTRLKIHDVSLGGLNTSPPRCCRRLAVQRDQPAILRCCSFRIWCGANGRVSHFVRQWQRVDRPQRTEQALYVAGLNGVGLRLCSEGILFMLMPPWPDGHRIREVRQHGAEFAVVQTCQYRAAIGRRSFTFRDKAEELLRSALLSVTGRRASDLVFSS
jgi:hypothetical protein